MPGCSVCYEAIQTLLTRNALSTLNRSQPITMAVCPKDGGTSCRWTLAMQKYDSYKNRKDNLNANANALSRRVHHIVNTAATKYQVIPSRPDYTQFSRKIQLPRYSQPYRHHLKNHLKENHGVVNLCYHFANCVPSYL